MTDTVDTQAAASARPGPTVGGKLKAAREAAGLSVDAVAQQLKLAPRQVKAIEDDDWHRLPGRTFVRGFARNYARFVQLDPDAVLALLPAPDTSPALERPALAASRRPMGEIPVERVAKTSTARWLVAILLLAVIAAIAYHELPLLQARVSALMGGSTPATGIEAGPGMPAETTPGGAPSMAPGATSALPNPIAEAPLAAAPNDATAKGAESSGPGSGVTVLPTPAAPDASATAAAATSSSVAPAPATPAAAMAEVPLVLAFKGTSWAEVKDAKGRVVLQMTGGPGMRQTVTAIPPLELALGNAREVGVTFRGQTLDLTPYTRGNVARVSLQ